MKLNLLALLYRFQVLCLVQEGLHYPQNCKSLSYIVFQHFLKIYLFYLFILFIYFQLRWVFVAARGLFSSCGERELLFVVVRGLLIAVASLVAEHGLQVHGPPQLWHVGSRVQAQQLWHVGLVAPRHVGSSWTRARTRVPCIGRRILNHCATREALALL